MRGGRRDPAVALGVGVQAVLVPEAAVGGDGVLVELDDERAAAGRDLADRIVEPRQPRRGGLGQRVDRDRVREREQEHVRARVAQARDHAVELADHRGDVDVAPQHVVEPREQRDEVGLQRQRGLELRLAHLPRQLPAHGEVRVEQIWLDSGEQFGQAVSPAAEPAPVGQRVHQSLGGAVPEGDEAPVAHAFHATVAACIRLVRLFTRGGSRGARCSSPPRRCSRARSASRRRDDSPPSRRERSGRRPEAASSPRAAAATTPPASSSIAATTTSGRRRSCRSPMPRTCARSSGGPTATASRSSPAPEATATTATRPAPAPSSSTCDG